MGEDNESTTVLFPLVTAIDSLPVSKNNDNKASSPES